MTAREFVRASLRHDWEFASHNPPRNPAPITELNGPPPQPVVNQRSAIVLRADTVRGLWNLLGSDVTIADMKLTGFDAGVVTKLDNAGRAGPTTVRDVVISSTGRGVLSLSSEDLESYGFYNQQHAMEWDFLCAANL